MTGLPLFDHNAMPDGVPPEVCALFERLALQLHGSGRERYSADAILHRVRWHFDIEKGNRGFKANNNWTAPLARWFLAKHPECAGFFELRERLDDGYSTAEGIATANTEGVASHGT